MNDKRKVILEDQLEAYGNRFSQHEGSPEGLFWNNQETQYLRFDRLLKPFDLSSPFTLLDVGCGTADMLDFIRQKKLPGYYVGNEIIQEMILHTRKKNPEIEIIPGSFLDNWAAPPRTFDYVVCSGVFNLRNTADPQEWREYCLAMILKMWSLADCGISFNFLTSYSDFTQDQLAYFDPKAMFDWCLKHLSRFVAVDHQYPLYECTISVMKDGFLGGRYDPKIYGKYFDGKA